MSSETFTYKGISAGKYVEGTIEAISQDEANFKLKEQKIIITNITRTKKKAADKKKKSGGGLSLFKKKIKPEDVVIFSKQELFPRWVCTSFPISKLTQEAITQWAQAWCDGVAHSPAKQLKVARV